MRTLLLAFLFLAVGACDDHLKSNPLPTEKQIAQLEERLANYNCIENLLMWERRYQFRTDVRRNSPSYGKVYLTTITFRLRRGSEAFPIQPGRSILPAEPSLSYEIDDRPGYRATGNLDTASGKVVLEYCGYSKGDS